MKMKNKTKNAKSIWDKRYQDGELACTKKNIASDPIDYTQHPFLYKESISKRLTGDLDGNPIEMIAENFFNPAAERMLAIGCGLAFKEELLVKNGYVKKLVAFEASPIAVDTVKKRIKLSGLQDKIDIFSGDVADASLQDESFDVVFIQAAIHHFYNIDEMFSLIHRVLKPGGRLLYDEYIGPDHHMYEPEVLELMDEVNNCLAPSFRWDTLRKETRTEVPQATLDWMLEMDPSEGVHSSQILPLTYKFFDVEFRRDYGGTFMRPFFVGILPNFDFEDEKDQTVARLIILIEELLMRKGSIPSYHTWVVGKKRDKPLINLTNKETKRINYSNWEAQEKYGQISPPQKIEEFSPADYSDSNWKNGVGLFGGAIVFLSATRQATHEFCLGRLAILADGTKRKIIGVNRDNESLIITLSGRDLDPDIIGYPNTIKLENPTALDK